MTFFTKKKKLPVTLILLQDAYERANQKEKKVFYYALYDNEKALAEQFCQKNKLQMVLDHVTDGNFIYKFTKLGE